MRSAALRPEQRVLLAFVGQSNSEMLDALVSDTALASLMARAPGACRPTAPEGAPEWMTSYETARQSFLSPSWGETPRVVVTAAQIRRFAQTVSAELREAIATHCAARTAEVIRTSGWCRCPYAHTAPNAHSRPCTRYHPSDAEDAEATGRYFALRDEGAALLHRALELDAGAQLDLFGALI